MWMQFSLTNKKLNSLVSSADELASIIHIWGDIGVGKTTLCYAASLSKLAQGKKVIYISTKAYFKESRFTEISSHYPSYDKYNFLLYTPSTFSQQTEILMNLEFLILEEIKHLQKTSIGLIVVDGVSILRNIEMGSEAKNNKTLRTLITTIATLDFIRRTYNIPILITNRPVIRVTDNRNVAQPASNVVMEFWGKTKIKIERTEVPTMREILLEHHPTQQNLPIRIQSHLTNSGFS